VDSYLARPVPVFSFKHGLAYETNPSREVSRVRVRARGEADGAAVGLKHRGAAVGPQEGADRDVEVGVGVVEVGVVGHHVDVDGGVHVGGGDVVHRDPGVVDRPHVDGDRGRRGRVVGPVGGLVGEAKPTRGVAVLGPGGPLVPYTTVFRSKHRGAAVGPQEGADRDVEVGVGVVEVGVVGHHVDVDGGV